MSGPVSPFLTVIGDASAPVCEGDVCVIPGTDAASDDAATITS